MFNQLSAHLGPIVETGRNRGDERRFQSPALHLYTQMPRSGVALLLGLSEETESPVIVGLNAAMDLRTGTRQAVFVPLNQLERAAQDGWAEHVNEAGRRIIAFTPQRLPDYVELRRTGDRSESVYDASHLLLPPSRIITDVVPKIEVASAALAERLKRRPEGVHELTPEQFEHLIGELFTDMHFRPYRGHPFVRDGGRDLLAYIDTEIGQLLCLIEVKKYRADRPVGIDLVRSLYGVLNDEDASHATPVTTSSFSAEALKFESRHKYRLSLRDYTYVAEWIRRYRTRKH